jgi:RHS repeat-associated protein
MRHGDVTATHRRTPRATTPGTYAGFDRFGRITQQRWHQSGGDKDKYLYVYDYNSNRTHKDNTTTTGLDEVYTYDKLDRLTAYDRGTLSGSYPTYAGGLTYKARNEAWTLSPTGNWNEYKVDADGDGDYEDQGDLDQDRQHNKANEITDISRTTGDDWADPVHDPRGNMTTIPRPASMTATYACTYDGWNRLVEVKHGQTTIGRYEYDGLGRRIRKQIDTQAPANPNGLDTYRHFFYNAWWQILETRKTTTASDHPESLHPESQYVWSLRYIDAPVLRDENHNDDDDCTDDGDGDERLYYLTDASMNVTALVETDGDVVERYAYDPYGRLTSDEPSGYGNAILYCGYWRDAETGLYHVRNRMYHPLLGRWLQRDPLVYIDGMDFYEYVGSMPTAAADPFGELIIYARGAVWKGVTEGLPWQSDALAKRWKQVAEKTGQKFYEAKYRNPLWYRDTGQVEKLADEVVEQIKKADPNEPIFIVGHSSGGAVVVRALEKLAKEKPNRRVSMVVLCDATVCRNHPLLAAVLANTSDETIILRSTNNWLVMWVASILGDAIKGQRGRNLGQAPDGKEGEIQAPEGSDSKIQERIIKGSHVDLLFKNVPVREKDYIKIKERGDEYLDEWLTKKYFPSEWGRTHYSEAQAQRAARERMSGMTVYPAH